ncbi:MAG: TetR-like C-terminal domain-containing protein [Spirochaetota bacterium]
MRQAEAAHADIYGKINAIAHAYWDFATKNRQLHRLMFSVRERSLNGRNLNSLPSSYRIFLETVRLGIVTGEFPNPRRTYLEIGAMLWSWMYGLLNLELNGLVRKSRRADPVQRGIDMFYMILKTAPKPEGKQGETEQLTP